MKKILFFLSLFLSILFFGQINDNTPGSNKTFNVPANVTHVNAAAWGGGGGGGGSNSNGDRGNGGGGGGASSNQIAVSSGNSFTYAVGAAGAASATGNNSGGNGGVSSISSSVPSTSFTANGGTGGRSNNQGLNTPDNSGGGAASGGTNSSGSNGTRGRNEGNGGNSGTAFGIFGTGGNGSTNSNGNPGGQPGAGGGGGEAGGGNKAGGAGAPGRVMFDYITVSSVSPSPACIGSTITITGTNFSTSGTTSVTINGVACTSISVVNSTTITTVVSTGTTSGTVDIINNGRRNNGKSITVNPSPAAVTVSGSGTFCGSTLITASGGTGGTIYFQGTTSGGTSQTTASSSQTVTSSGTYYFRSRNADGCWGNQGSVAVVINSNLTAIAGSPVPTNTATGICYQGLGSVASVNWATVTDATSYDVYFGAGSLPGSITSNVATTSYNTGTLLPNTTYYWKIVPRNSCGITTGTPVIWSFTTSAAPCSCTPSTSNPSINYINDVEFRGTLNDVVNNNNGSSGGYQNFTGLANKTIQAAGEGINVFVKSSGRDTTWKAWVDWNRDGTFNNAGGNSEIVFVKSTQAISTAFGFVIPANTAPGDYVIRIRNYRSCVAATGFCGNTTYDPCAAFTGTNNGEAEDYIITVVANCASTVASVVSAESCGATSLMLSAKGNAGTTKIRWYDAETGGTMLAETAVDGALQANYSTGMLSASKTYWVTSYNGTCETIYRKPVLAKIKPIPALSFNLPPANANFCGEDDRLILTTAGDEEEVNLINEDFEAGGLGVFERGYGNTVTPQTQNNNVRWQDKESIFIPSGGAIWVPAISSGYDKNKFAFSTSDYSNARVETTLSSTNSYNTTGFTSLNLAFSVYYSYYGDESTGISEGFFVEVSTNGGTSWTTINTYTNSLGYGTRFEDIIIPLDAYRNITLLKVRFRYKAYWGDGIAIDDIKLYGNRPLTTSFTWTAPNIGVFQSDCTTPYINGTTTSSVCIKPSDTQMQTIADWNISASANLSNGCTTASTIAIHNQNKVWDTTAATSWETTNWQPTTTVPDITKCVLIKKPVNILTGGNFEAKKVKVVTGGQLIINKDSSLKIQDELNNAVAATDVLIESEGNLIQVNDGVNINTGAITVKKTVKISNPRQQYNYLISPLEGQTLKTIYPGIDYVLYHNEANNYFYSSSGAYIKGRGLAVKEPNNGGVSAGTPTVNATFTGKPTNGAFSYSMINSAPLATSPSTVVRGYNLIGNPYPSNIDLVKLYEINGGDAGTLSQTFYFWDSSVNDIYVQQGSNYGGQSYGQFNAVSGLGVPANGDIGSVSIIQPTKYVKVGKGFMARSLSATTNLLFNNSIRTNASVPLDSRGIEASEDSGNRYWLSLVSPANIASTMAVAYFQGGNNAYARDDSFSLMGSDALYSIVENQNLSINGKSPFVVNDVVDLGTSHFGAGNYRIMLKQTEGIFANGQTIYLKDKQTGTITNLMQGAYAFAANAGVSTGRFEIIYEPETVLATNGNAKEEITVYRDGNDFVVKSASKKITALECFDAAGRLMIQLSPNQKEVHINATNFVNGIYLLKINRNGEMTTKKVMR